MNPVLKGYLRLTRPANLPTAAADVIAGIAIAGLFIEPDTFYVLINEVIALVLASVCLYAGGVVLNDFFDYELDVVERPERPIPSGLIKLKNAAILGGFLLFLGVFLAFFVNALCGFIALALAIAILLYDKFAKHNAFLGPVNMGVCRGLNLLLGIAILGELNHWYFSIIPILYIAAITLISRGEVHGDNKKHIILAGLLYAVVICAITGLFLSHDHNILPAIPFIILFAIMIYRPLIAAYKENSPQNIKKAVIAGVLSLIILDASVAVGFSQWWLGIAVLLLLPLSMLLSRLFAVT
ncbi:UbiA-like protein EboC [Leeuwenhoekiella sp. A16]|uniref:UbiA-like protein EboC n=1 Tax=unclassified Leeuwenhoekiella TaxID=2615029 RepID=UPI003A8043D9|tara:strand:- start:23040 stop:23930 length:891 start_codon:yes stop_codon:yes gene_type:complete